MLTCAVALCAVCLSFSCAHSSDEGAAFCSAQGESGDRCQAYHQMRVVRGFTVLLILLSSAYVILSFGAQAVKSVKWIAVTSNVLAGSYSLSVSLCLSLSLSASLSVSLNIIDDMCTPPRLSLQLSLFVGSHS
jgi:hypothetical protein